MRSSAGGGDRKLGVLFGARVMQSRDQIARQERTIRRHAQNPGYLGPVGRGPVKGSENARQRSGMVRHGVGDDGQGEVSEPCRIAIGAKNKSVALRRQPRDRARQDGVAADWAHRLVAAAHPPRQPAGEQHARRRRRVP